MGLNKPSSFEYCLCIKVEGHDQIVAVDMVKERDVIRHLNDLFQKAHRRTAIKKIVDGYVAEMFFDLNIHLISIGQVYGRFDKSLGLLFTLRQGEVRDTAVNLFHDFLKRRSMTAIG